MSIDTDLKNKYLNIFYIIFCSLCVIFLLILIRPLYIFSKERTALFYSFKQVVYIEIFLFQNLIGAGFSIYFHIIGLALNRFQAVFFPFSYQNLWKNNDIKYIIFLIWIIIFFWSALQYTLFNLNPIQNGFISIFSYGIILYGDFPIFTAIFIATPIYTAILVKFIYDYNCCSPCQQCCTGGCGIITYLENILLK
ncbi:hypothetical protein Mgra_00008770 [Meloidogyne graminicola]|uniref:Uncharacterized protein n=1 Tax=Meloidogyne graminicola TaxID=189291 RepID=A0A8S9ZEW8_9BILA|nr:hypothetical protein Mgra_00008770 [Meloidogyne graminicola]